MSIIFSIFDIILTFIMLYDSLGLVYQFRRNIEIQKKDYYRICFSWVLFLTICKIFTCDKEGKLGSIIRIIILVLKLFVAIPIFKGTMIIYSKIIENGKLELILNNLINKIISKLNSKEKDCSTGSCGQRVSDRY